MSDREVPGFFFIGINGEFVGASGSPLPKQFKSIEACKAFILEIYGTKIDRMNVTQEIEGFPVVWSITVDLSRPSSREQSAIITFMYIGSFKYHSGKKVDPLLVGTQFE